MPQWRENKKDEGSGNIVLHVLTSDTKQAAEWVQASKRENMPDSQKGYVCSKHFVSEEYVRYLKFELMNPGMDSLQNKKRILKDSAITSQNIPKKICMTKCDLICKVELIIKLNYSALTQT